MSFDAAMQRVSELNSLVEGPATGSRDAARASEEAGQFAALLDAAEQRGVGTGTTYAANGQVPMGAAGMPGGAPAAMPYAMPGGLPMTYTPVSPGIAGGYPPGLGYPPPVVLPGMPGPYPSLPGVVGVGGSWPTTWPPTQGTVGNRIVQLAQAELGVREAPSGSNDAPRIRDYRTATAGAQDTPGPWCAYFVSWLCREAGAPIGAGGRGTGYVPTLEAWGRSAGRWVEGTQRPQPGDIVIINWGGSGISDHTGIVERVGADGRIHTIEGNSSNMVARRSYEPGSAHVKGFVRAG